MAHDHERPDSSSSKKMTRRTFTQAAAVGGTAALLGASSKTSSAQVSGDAGAGFPQVAGLTRQVAEFITRTTYADVPEDVIELGKKSILDSLGLALCSSVS